MSVKCEPARAVARAAAARARHRRRSVRFGRPQISAAADPRARLLRRRRRALRWALIFGVGSVFWGVVTALLAAWGWFALLLEITGFVAAVRRFPRRCCCFRYHWLRVGAVARAAARQRPPAAAARFGRATRDVCAGRFRTRLLLVVGCDRARRHVAAGRDPRLDSRGQPDFRGDGGDRYRGGVDGAGGAYSESSRSYLVPTINAFTAQLSAGVRQYNEMVTAAAQLVSSVNGEARRGPGRRQQRYRAELVDATDRLVGWAQAFDELGGLPRR